MRRRAFLATALFALPILGTGAWADVEKDTFAQLDKLVDQAMAAYNSQRSKEFYANWATVMKAVQTEEQFQKKYVNKSHKEFGRLQSRTKNPDKSFIHKDSVILIYTAVFDKKPGVLQVNFMKEGNLYKIMNVGIQDPK